MPVIAFNKPAAKCSQGGLCLGPGLCCRNVISLSALERQNMPECGLFEGPSNVDEGDLELPIPKIRMADNVRRDVKNWHRVQRERVGEQMFGNGCKQEDEMLKSGGQQVNEGLDLVSALLKLTGVSSGTQGGEDFETSGIFVRESKSSNLRAVAIVEWDAEGPILTRLNVELFHGPAHGRFRSWKRLHGIFRDSDASIAACKFMKAA